MPRIVAIGIIVDRTSMDIMLTRTITIVVHNGTNGAVNRYLGLNLSKVL